MVSAKEKIQAIRKALKSKDTKALRKAVITPITPTPRTTPTPSPPRSGGGGGGGRSVGSGVRTTPTVPIDEKKELPSYFLPGVGDVGIRNLTLPEPKPKIPESKPVSTPIKTTLPSKTTISPILNRIQQRNLNLIQKIQGKTQPFVGPVLTPEMAKQRKIENIISKIEKRREHLPPQMRYTGTGKVLTGIEKILVQKIPSKGKDLQEYQQKVIKENLPSNIELESNIRKTLYNLGYTSQNFGSYKGQIVLEDGRVIKGSDYAELVSKLADEQKQKITQDLRHQATKSYKEIRYMPMQNASTNDPLIFITNYATSKESNELKQTFKNYQMGSASEQQLNEAYNKAWESLPDSKKLAYNYKFDNGIMNGKKLTIQDYAQMPGGIEFLQSKYATDLVEPQVNKLIEQFREDIKKPIKRSLVEEKRYYSLTYKIIQDYINRHGLKLSESQRQLEAMAKNTNLMRKAFIEYLTYTPTQIKQMEYSFRSPTVRAVQSAAQNLPRAAVGMVTFAPWLAETAASKITGKEVQIPIIHPLYTGLQEQTIKATEMGAPSGTVGLVTTQAITGLTQTREGAPTFEQWKKRRIENYNTSLKKWEQARDRYLQSHPGSFAGYRKEQIYNIPGYGVKPARPTTDQLTYQWEYGAIAPESYYAQRYPVETFVGGLAELAGFYYGGKGTSALTKYTFKGIKPIVSPLITGKYPTMIEKAGWIARGPTIQTSFGLKPLISKVPSFSRKFFSKATTYIDVPKVITISKEAIARRPALVKTGQQFFDWSKGKYKPPSLMQEIKTAPFALYGKIRGYGKYPGEFATTGKALESRGLQSIVKRLETKFQTGPVETGHVIGAYSDASKWKPVLLKEVAEIKAAKTIRPLTDIYNPLSKESTTIINTLKTTPSTILTGSKAMMLQTKLGIKRFIRGFSVADFDILVIGSSKKAKSVANEYLSVLKKQTGKTYNLRELTGHKGTFRIEDPAILVEGKPRPVMDFTSSEARSLSEKAFGKYNSIPTENIHGLKVADLDYLIFQKGRMFLELHSQPTTYAQLKTKKAITDLQVSTKMSSKQLQESLASEASATPGATLVSKKYSIGFPEETFGYSERTLKMGREVVPGYEVYHTEADRLAGALATSPSTKTTYSLLPKLPKKTIVAGKMERYVVPPKSVWGKPGEYGRWQFEYLQSTPGQTGTGFASFKTTKWGEVTPGTEHEIGTSIWQKYKKAPTLLEEMRPAPKTTFEKLGTRYRKFMTRKSGVVEYKIHEGKFYEVRPYEWENVIVKTRKPMFEPSTTKVLEEPYKVLEVGKKIESTNINQLIKTNKIEQAIQQGLVERDIIPATAKIKETIGNVKVEFGEMKLSSPKIQGTAKEYYMLIKQEGKPLQRIIFDTSKERIDYFNKIKHNIESGIYGEPEYLPLFTPKSTLYKATYPEKIVSYEKPSIQKKYTFDVQKYDYKPYQYPSYKPYQYKPKTLSYKPQYKQPQYVTPKYQQPKYEVPKYEIPKYKQPKYSYKVPEYQYKPPTYQAPKYTYQPYKKYTPKYQKPTTYYPHYVPTQPKTKKTVTIAKKPTVTKQKFYTERFFEFPTLASSKYPKPFAGPSPAQFKSITWKTFKTQSWIKKEKRKALTRAPTTIPY